MRLEPGMERARLRRAGLQRKDIGMGEEKARGVEIVEPVGGARIEPRERTPVIRRVRLEDRRLQPFHSAARAMARRASILPATQSWKQWVGLSITGEKRPPSKRAAWRPRCIPSTTKMSSSNTVFHSWELRMRSPSSLSGTE